MGKNPLGGKDELEDRPADEHDEPHAGLLEGESIEGESIEGESIEAVPIEEAIDLHGFQPRDMLSVVEEYLLAARDRGFREVRLIHGRGIGFQRQRVRELLEEHPLVERFADAPAYRGGWGATLVWLRLEPPAGRRE